MNPSISGADLDFAIGSVASADGTTIGYRRLGQGPAVVLVHGGMMSSQNLTALGRMLSNDFSVVIPDRRGRGLSGPFGRDYGLGRATEDVVSLLADTQASRVFGVSVGAIPVLNAALELPGNFRIALFEPPLPVTTSPTVPWLRRFDSEVASDKLGDAMATMLKGTGAEGLMKLAPRGLIALLFRFALRAEAVEADQHSRTALRDLVLTMHDEAKVILDSGDLLERCGGAKPTFLLLGGTRSARDLRQTLGILESRLPVVSHIRMPGVGHDVADNGGKPDLVAERLRSFFA
jgi:pimeloyl-ACP methyl ester carboxylesterase